MERGSLLFLSALLGCTKQAPEATPPHAQAEGTYSPVRATPTAPPATTADPAASTSARALVASSAIDAAVVVALDAGGSGVVEAPMRVKLATIGMHVGGGPYDEPTKEPMKRSVEPRFTELARCWKHVGGSQPVDIGVDLVIESGGGHAQVSHPRTFATAEGFVPCVVLFFEQVDFQKPKNGKTVVSYSVRFSP